MSWPLFVAEPRAVVALQVGQRIARSVGSSICSPTSSQKRHALSAREGALVAAWTHGLTLDLWELGWKAMRREARNILAERGLGYCCILKRVFFTQEMYNRLTSLEGQRRHTLWREAKKRAGKKALPFDDVFMRIVVFGPLPTEFAGVAYDRPLGQPGRRGPTKMSLTVDRIVGSKGYAKGNVRFLPFWINVSLQAFSDGKALLIAQRLAGLRQWFMVELAPASHHGHIRRMLGKVRSRAIRHGIQLGTCFTFESLLLNGKFVSRCPFSGIHLSYGTKSAAGGLYNSPSFDRIDPSQGYTCANVQVVSRAVNSFKSDIPLGGMQQLLEAIAYLSTPMFKSSHVPGCM